MTDSYVASTKPIDTAKHRTRAAWAAGDYGAVARREFWMTGERLVRRVGLRPGETALDVACGTGNAALRAAAAGASVTALDLTPELLMAGRELARDAGVAIRWVEGDAENLPFDEGSFDVVVSAFGCMFAPDHERAAAELVRVLKPGGRLAICAWTPEGAMGQFFRTLARHMPPAGPGDRPPLLWGSEAHARALFAGAGMELTFERDTVPSSYDFPTVDAAVAYYTTTFGPLVMARRRAEAAGSWPALEADLRTFLTRQARERPDAEYLLTLARRGAARAA